MTHIFISYAHADRDFAENLALRLEKAGFQYWLDNDRLRAGNEWRQDIDDAIRQAIATIVVVSPDAGESKYVAYEWAFALGANIEVVPIMCKPTDLHPRLEPLQHFDFTEKTRPWNELIQRLHEAKSHYSPYTPINKPPSIDEIVLWLDRNISQVLPNAMPDSYRGEVWAGGMGLNYAKGRIASIKIETKQWKYAVMDNRKKILGFTELKCRVRCQLELDEDSAKRMHPLEPVTFAIGTLDCYVLARTVVLSISELLQEINTYRQFVDTPCHFCLVSPDQNYADILAAQNVGFIEYRTD